ADRAAVQPAQIPRDRLAQLRKAGLVGVKGLTAAQCRAGRLADKVRGRQVALAIPQRYDFRVAEPERRNLGDPRGWQRRYSLADRHGSSQLRPGASAKLASVLPWICCSDTSGANSRRVMRRPGRRTPKPPGPVSPVASTP